MTTLACRSGPVSAMLACCSSREEPAEHAPRRQVTPMTPPSSEDSGDGVEIGGGIALAPFDVTVELDHSSDRIGLHLGGVGENLRVVRVLQGVVATWNEAHPESAVERGDLIVEVNGTRGGGGHVPASEAFMPLLWALQEGTEFKIKFGRKAAGVRPFASMSSVAPLASSPGR
mmetsp:Transcript_46522/g.135512  ORF Transcript_46522/g.135512 Transcript_46522/m.135512 type:complete len:173 (+) Transcript_46522:106-624(+)